MPAPIWIVLLTSFVLTILPPFLIGLVLLLVPGRKGKMRTTREIMHDSASAEQVRAGYEERLTRDEFTIEDVADPLLVRASRRKPLGSEAHGHGDKPIAIEIQLVPGPSGVRAGVSGWIDDFVFYDTGEGRLIDLTLERLTSNEAEYRPPPIVPNLSYLAVSSLVAALLCIATIALLVARTTSSSIHLAAVVGGAVIGSLSAMVMSREAMKVIRLRPLEVRGTGVVTATYVIGGVGIIAGAAVLLVRFRETLIEAARQSFQ